MDTCTRLPSFLIEALSKPLLEMAATTEPSQVLGKQDDDYLHRWYVERSRERGNVYLHRTLRSDVDYEMHDHPWDNVTIALTDLAEELQTADGRAVIQRPAGSIIFRKATDRHRLIVAEPSWTLFLTGPKVREWGFLMGNGSWMHNQDFFQMRGYF